MYRSRRKRSVREQEVAGAWSSSELVVDRDLERGLEQRAGLLEVAPAEDDSRFRAQRKRERSRVDLRLGDVERQLGALAGPVEIAAEPVVPREARSEHRQTLIRLVARDDREGALHPLPRPRRAGR